MYNEFKENIILLMQHTDLMRIPLSNLSEGKKEIVRTLLTFIVDVSTNEKETMLDYIQLARLHYNLAELDGMYMYDNIHHYKEAIECVVKGGIDLSMDKWLELSNLRVTE